MKTKTPCSLLEFKRWCIQKMENRHYIQLETTPIYLPMRYPKIVMRYLFSVFLLNNVFNFFNDIEGCSSLVFLFFFANGHQIVVVIKWGSTIVVYKHSK
jgi:hypothetical protein